MKHRDTEDYVDSFLQSARETSRSAQAKLEKLTRYLEGMTERLALIRQSELPGAALPLLHELSAAQQVLAAFECEHRESQEALDRTRVMLERERAKYLDLFESATEASMLTSLRAVVREANTASGALLNMPARFLVGKPLLHFVARQDTREFRARVRELEEHPSNDDFELRIRPRHGSVMWTRVAAAPVRGPGGSVMGLRWLIRAKPVETEASASDHNIVPPPDDSRDTLVSAVRLATH
jgi:PAS domain S-box-containing protein